MRGYQNRATRFILRLKTAFLFLDMGLGKTVIALGAIKFLKLQRGSIRALVVAPARVLRAQTWEDEADEWEHTRDLKIVQIAGSPRHRDKMFVKRADVYLISYDNLRWLFQRYRRFLNLFDVIVFDESSKMKHSSTKRFLAAKGKMKFFEFRWGLTGTPATKGLKNLFAQTMLIDLGKRFGTRIGAFRNKYMEPTHKVGEYATGQAVYNWQMTAEGSKQVTRLIKPISLRLDAKDYLELPQQIDKWEDLYLSPQLQRRYDKMREDMYIQLLLDEVDVTTRGSLFGKCHQFSNGAMYTDNPLWEEIHDIKLKALEEIIDEVNEKPMLVCYFFKHDLTRLRERFNKLFKMELPYQGTAEELRNWKKRKYPLMFMHPSSSFGLNIQEGGNIVTWFSLTSNLEHYLQTVKRLVRSGQKEDHVLNYHLIMKRTVDSTIRRSLERDTSIQEELFREIQR